MYCAMRQRMVVESKRGLYKSRVQKKNCQKLARAGSKCFDSENFLEFSFEVTKS